MAPVPCVDESGAGARYAGGVSKAGSHRLTADEERQVREAENRLHALYQDAEQAHAEGRLAELIRDTPGVRQQVDSVSDL
jgi:hypothetical protein